MKGEQNAKVERIMPMGRLNPMGSRYSKSRKATKTKHDRAKAKRRRLMAKQSRRRNRR
jgi:hypothetical protein